MVLFGGDNGRPYLNDTWAWTGTTWAQQSPAARARRSTAPPTWPMTPPPASSSCSAATTAPAPISTTPGTGPAPPGPSSHPSTSPPVRDNASMAYDATTNQMVLFGGSNSSYLADTWLIGAPSVTAVSPVYAARPRAAPLSPSRAPVSMPPRRQRSMFGSTPATSYTVSSSTSITAVSPAETAGHRRRHRRPGARARARRPGPTSSPTRTPPGIQASPVASPTGPLLLRCEAYDPATGQTILYGGIQRHLPGRHLGLERHHLGPALPGDNPGVARQPRHVLRRRHQPADLVRRRRRGVALGTTWAWNGTTWTEVATTAQGPDHARVSEMVYDASTQQLILFGGYNGSDPSRRHLGLERNAHGPSCPRPTPAVALANAVMGYDPPPAS